MSKYVEPQTNISQSWLETLKHVHDAGGRAVHVLSTIMDPAAPDNPGIRAAVDQHLSVGMRGKVRIQPVDTVAGTIFSPLYRSPGFKWSPDLSKADKEALDNAATSLYERYSRMLPQLTKFRANSHGTYFGRMVSWPGRSGGGVNQVQDRINALRSLRKRNVKTFNAADISVGHEATWEPLVDDGIPGLQIYAATDRRSRGFPCLVHVDLSLFQGRLNMIATYRHQYLITKAYGNMVGLARLQRFIAEQSGYEVGELAIMATMADAEYGVWGGRRGVEKLIVTAEAALHPAIATPVAN
jgi:hypothetical protein